MPNQNKRTVDWMHPSWRDLVIEQLAKDNQARHNFLLKCGCPGFLLALSVAGGSTGSRQMPLLQDTKDWETLCAAAPHVLKYGWYAQREVLSHLHSALAACDQTYSAETQLGKLGYTTLAALREIWNSGEQMPDGGLLGLFYPISEKLSPLIPGPNLQPSWDAYLEVAIEQLNAFDPDEREVKLNEVDDWLDLAETISGNEPRFLRQVCFPKDFTELVSNLLSGIKRRAGLRFDFDDGDDCVEEESDMDELTSIVERMQENFDSLEAEAKDTWRKVRENRLRVEELRHDFENELEERERAERERERPEQVTGDEPADEDTSILDEFVDVGHLFADL